ncbi:unnamed protein product [Bemisia tabaci]|uniref:MYND-type domain-containing protein n=2 Tax=Bemisia tabaci TaxID=7038 RepID=A0A9P0AEG5_BEMTA|nr:unnamed protein product [Bemisia tabaci]
MCDTKKFCREAAKRRAFQIMSQRISSKKRAIKKWKIKNFVRKSSAKKTTPQKRTKRQNTRKASRKWNIKNFILKPKSNCSDLGISEPKNSAKNKGIVGKKREVQPKAEFPKPSVQQLNTPQINNSTEAPQVPKKLSTVKKKRKWDLKNFIMKSPPRQHYFQEMPSARILPRKTPLPFQPVVKLRHHDVLWDSKIRSRTGLSLKKWEEYYRRGNVTVATDSILPKEKPHAQKRKRQDEEKNLLEIYGNPLKKVKRKETLDLFLSCFGPDSETDSVYEEWSRTKKKVSGIKSRDIKSIHQKSSSTSCRQHQSTIKRTSEASTKKSFNSVSAGSTSAHKPKSYQSKSRHSDESPQVNPKTEKEVSSIKSHKISSKSSEQPSHVPFTSLIKGSSIFKEVKDPNRKSQESCQNVDSVAINSEKFINEAVAAKHHAPSLKEAVVNNEAQGKIINQSIKEVSCINILSPPFDQAPLSQQNDTSEASTQKTALSVCTGSPSAHRTESSQNQTMEMNESFPVCSASLSQQNESSEASTDQSSNELVIHTEPTQILPNLSYKELSSHITDAIIQKVSCQAKLTDNKELQEIVTDMSTAREKGGDLKTLLHKIQKIIDKPLLEKFDNDFIVKFHEEYKSWAIDEKNSKAQSDFILNMKHPIYVLKNIKNNNMLSKNEKLQMTNQKSNEIVNICKLLPRIFTPVLSHDSFPLFVLIFTLRTYLTIFMVDFKTGRLDIDDLNLLRSTLKVGLGKLSIGDLTAKILFKMLKNDSFIDSCHHIWFVMDLSQKLNSVNCYTDFTCENTNDISSEAPQRNNEVVTSSASPPRSSESQLDSIVVNTNLSLDSNRSTTVSSTAPKISSILNSNSCSKPLGGVPISEAATKTERNRKQNGSRGQSNLQASKQTLVNHEDLRRKRANKGILIYPSSMQECGNFIESTPVPKNIRPKTNLQSFAPSSSSPTGESQKENFPNHHVCTTQHLRSLNTKSSENSNACQYFVDATLSGKQNPERTEFANPSSNSAAPNVFLAQSPLQPLSLHKSSSPNLQDGSISRGSSTGPVSTFGTLGPTTINNLPMAPIVQNNNYINQTTVIQINPASNYNWGQMQQQVQLPPVNHTVYPPQYTPNSQVVWTYQQQIAPTSAQIIGNPQHFPPSSSYNSTTATAPNKSTSNYYVQSHQINLLQSNGTNFTQTQSSSPSIVLNLLSKPVNTNFSSSQSGKVERIPPVRVDKGKSLSVFSTGGQSLAALPINNPIHENSRITLPQAPSSLRDISKSLATRQPDSAGFSINNTINANSRITPPQAQSSLPDTSKSTATKLPDSGVHEKSALVDQTITLTGQDGIPFVIHVKSAENLTTVSEISGVNTGKRQRVKYTKRGLPDQMEIIKWKNKSLGKFMRKGKTKLIPTPDSVKSQAPSVCDAKTNSCKDPRPRVKYTERRPPDQVRRNPSLGKFMKRRKTEPTPRPDFVQAHSPALSEGRSNSTWDSTADLDNLLIIEESSPISSSDRESTATTKSVVADSDRVSNTLQEISSDNFCEDGVLETPNNSEKIIKSNGLTYRLEQNGTAGKTLKGNSVSSETQTERSLMNDKGEENGNQRKDSCEPFPSSATGTITSCTLMEGDSVENGANELNKAKDTLASATSVAKHKLPASIARPASVFGKRIGKQKKNDSVSVNRTPVYQVVNDVDNALKVRFELKKFDNHGNTGKPRRASDTIIEDSSTSTSNSKDHLGNSTSKPLHGKFSRRYSDTSLRKERTIDVDTFLQRSYEEIENDVISMYLKNCEGDRCLDRKTLLSKILANWKNQPIDHIYEWLRNQEPFKANHEADISCSKNQMKVCSNIACGKALVGPINPCAGCNKVFYCSSTCRDVDFQQSHCNVCESDIFI